MKALVKYKKGDGFLKLQDIEKPKLHKNEVLIKVKFCGICGSDIHILHDEFKNSPPVTIGHEFSGYIAEVGKDVKGWEIADRVSSELHIGACRSCYLCKSRKYHICPEKKPLGSMSDGALAEYIKVPSWLLHKIPDNVSYEKAALFEPVAICVHCILEKTKINPDDFVFISGAGPIGLICSQIVKIAGVRKVAIAGTTKDTHTRFNVAKKLGINYIINVEKDDCISILKKLTNGKWPDLVIEASGSPKAISLAFEVVRRSGKIIALGMTKEEKVNIPWNLGILKSIELILPFSSNYSSWEKAISLISSKKIDVAQIITHKFILADWEKAFNLVEKGECIKILLNPLVEKSFLM